MDKVIKAVFENGVFRPIETIDLKEGSSATVIVETDSTFDSKWNAARAAAVLREIASIPADDPPLPAADGKPVSEDVDQYLYGDRSEFARKKT